MNNINSSQLTDGGSACEVSVNVSCQIPLSGEAHPAADRTGAYILLLILFQHLILWRAHLRLQHWEKCNVSVFTIFHLCILLYLYYLS